jgi:hypothetical protein
MAGRLNLLYIKKAPVVMRRWDSSYLAKRIGFWSMGSLQMRVRGRNRQGRKTVRRTRDWRGHVSAWMTLEGAPPIRLARNEAHRAHARRIDRLPQPCPSVVRRLIAKHNCQIGSLRSGADAILQRQVVQEEAAGLRTISLHLEPDLDSLPGVGARVHGPLNNR